MAKKRVLIVDDEVDFLRITKFNLDETNEYGVKTLSSAKGIVLEIHAFRPDVILLDLVMPGVGGIEACEQLNKDAFGRNIPIIIISALDKDTDKLKAYKAGVVDYLAKSVEKDELVAKIEKALRSK